MHFELSAYSHIGQRDLNQDYFAHVTHSDWGCFMVADGLGGHESGEIASSYYLESVMSLCTEYAPKIEATPKRALRQMLLSAAKLFRERIQDEFGILDTQTTFALAWVNSKHLLTAHIGDSRIYRLNEKKVLMRTIDHSALQEAIDSGMIDIDEDDEIMQSTLLRALNTYEVPDVEIHTRRALKKNEGLLLCTDGFWTNIEESQYSQLLQSKSIKKDLESWINHIIDTPECDNVTAMMVVPKAS